MEELMVVANVAIIFGVVYKLFELFVGKIKDSDRKV